MCLESILILFKGQSIERSQGFSERNFIFHLICTLICSKKGSMHFTVNVTERAGIRELIDIYGRKGQGRKSRDQIEGNTSIKQKWNIFVSKSRGANI